MADPIQIATRWTKEHCANPYLSDTINVVWSWDDGTIKCPVAGPPGTPAVAIRVCAAHGQRVVAWAFKRAGKKPLMPAREPNSTYQNFSNMVIIVDQVQMFPDGRNPIYVCGGILIYDLLLPPTESGGYPLPMPPTIEGAGIAATITTQDFSPAILGTRAAPPVPLNQAARVP